LQQQRYLFDVTVAVDISRPGETESYDYHALASFFSLIVVIIVDIPTISNATPTWISKPDPTRLSRTAASFRPLRHPVLTEM